MPVRYYESEQAEFFGNNNRTAAEVMMNGAIRAAKESDMTEAQIQAEVTDWDRQVQASSDAAIKDVIPYLNKHGVDLYAAGHWHYYE
jgi:hypothetical protein